MTQNKKEKSGRGYCMRLMCLPSLLVGGLLALMLAALIIPAVEDLIQGSEIDKVKDALAERDCDYVLDKGNEIYGSPSDYKGDIREEAYNAVKICEFYVEAVENTENGDYDLALYGYFRMIKEDTADPTGISADIVNLMTEYSADELASDKSCDHIGALESVDAGEEEPRFAYSCALWNNREREYRSAAYYYNYLLEHYPDHLLAEKAEAELPDALYNYADEVVNDSEQNRYAIQYAIEGLDQLIADYPDYENIRQATRMRDNLQSMAADIEGSDAAAQDEGYELEQPAGVSVGGSMAVVVIQNASLRKLAITISKPGSQNIFEQVEPCLTCGQFQSCSATNPSHTFRLLPGDYTINIAASGTAAEIVNNPVIPIYGEWSVEAGMQYASCLSIQDN